MAERVDPRSDEALMRDYVGGDSEAFRALFDRFGPQLLRLATRHLGSEELAREVVQQTFFQMHAARLDFRLDRRLRPWLFTIMMNLVRQHYRRAGRRREVGLDETRELGSPPPEHGPVERRQRAQMLRAALDRLPASQRSVVELHWFEERPYAEVAEIVGSTEGAVRVRAHRAFQRLRELLGEALQ